MACKWDACCPLENPKAKYCKACGCKRAADAAAKRARRGAVVTAPSADNPPKGERVVFLGDQQIPFQDKGLEQAVFRFLDDYDPDTIFLVGDVIDCYGISAHLKDPTRKETLWDDLEQTKYYLHLLRVCCPTARIVYTYGNHEDRLRKYLWSAAKELADFPSLQLATLLDLEAQGIEWLDYMVPFDYHGFLVVHGDLVRRHSGHTAKAMFERYGVSGLSGHTHRLGSYAKRDFDGAKVWYENGCLCTLTPEYVKFPNWQQGFSIGQFIGTRFFVEQIPVHDDGAFLYQGKLYR